MKRRKNKMPNYCEKIPLVIFLSCLLTPNISETASNVTQINLERLLMWHGLKDGGEFSGEKLCGNLSFCLDDDDHVEVTRKSLKLDTTTKY